MALLPKRASRTAKQREWRRQLRLRARQERALSVSLAAEFTRVSKRAASGYRRAGRSGALAALNGHKGRIKKLLTQSSRRAFETVGKDFMKEAKGLEIRQTEDESGDLFSRLMRRWLLKFGNVNSTIISELTKLRILNAIISGDIAGEAVFRIAAAISDVGLLSKARGILIARTEIHSAANAANDAAAEAVGLGDLKREWIASIDNRTRDTHIAADGQKKARDKKFTVGASKLRFPGDPQGAPEEIINCRCTLGFIVP